MIYAYATWNNGRIILISLTIFHNPLEKSNGFFFFKDYHTDFLKCIVRLELDST